MLRKQYIDGRWSLVRVVWEPFLDVFRRKAIYTQVLWCHSFLVWFIFMIYRCYNRSRGWMPVISGFKLGEVKVSVAKFCTYIIVGGKLKGEDRLSWLLGKRPVAKFSILCCLVLGWKVRRFSRDARVIRDRKKVIFDNAFSEEENNNNNKED